MAVSLKFPITKKIKSKKEIGLLLKKGTRWRCDHFTLVFKKNTLYFDRMAVLVSKKIGSAHTRNYVKRIFREIFRQTILVDPPYFDIVICPKKPITVKFGQLKQVYEKWRLKGKKS